MKHLKHWERVRPQHVAIIEFVEWLQQTWDIRLDYDYAKPGTPLDFKKLVDNFLEVDQRGLEADRQALIGKIRQPFNLKVQLGLSFVHDGWRYATVQFVQEGLTIAAVDFVDGNKDRELIADNMRSRRGQIIRIATNFLQAEEAEGPIYRNYGEGPDYV